MIIALDCDGVLLDYHAAYRFAWEQAFGVLPVVVDPHAYWPIERYAVRCLAGEELAHFRQHFDEQFWSSIPVIPGALEACRTLSNAGFELVCVTAIDPLHREARVQNLRIHDFPIERVIATSNADEEVSPKAAALAELRPVAFVDDFLPYFRGIPAGIHAALILREPNGSPNSGADLRLVHSQHADLADFAKEWLA